MQPKKDRYLNFRIDSETLKKIDELAKADSRSRSAMVLLLLKKALTM